MSAGVKELGEFLSCVAAFANASGKALEDGKISIGDVAYLMPALLKLPSAIEGFAELKVEFKDLDQAELAVLKDQFAKDFDLPQESVEAAVEQGFEVAVMLVKLVSDLRKK